MRGDDEPELVVDLPSAHTTGHTELLGDPSPEALTAWGEALTECAELRCPYAADRVAVASIDAEVVRTAAEAALNQLLAGPSDGADDRPDVPAVATVVGALTPLLPELPNRAAALRWHDRWQPRLAAVGRCDRDDRSTVVCPDCRADRPCALDTWQDRLAVAARGAVTPASRKSFLHVSGADLGRGVLTTWLSANRRLLAGAVAWRVYQEHREAGQVAAAELFARYAYVASAVEPRLAAAYANLLAAPGSIEALERGINLCGEALLYRNGSTHDGWTQLAAKRGQLLGRLTRLRGRPSGALDEDGNPIPVRRHHPEDPQRSRGRRFAVS